MFMFILFFSILLEKTCSSPCFILSKPNSWTRSTRYVAEFLRCFWSRSRRPWRPCLSRKWSATLGRFTDSIAELQQMQSINDKEKSGFSKTSGGFFVVVGFFLLFFYGTCAIPRPRCGFLTSFSVWKGCCRASWIDWVLSSGYYGINGSLMRGLLSKELNHLSTRAMWGEKTVHKVNTRVNEFSRIFSEELV